MTYHSYQIVTPWGEAIRVAADMVAAEAAIYLLDDDGEPTLFRPRLFTHMTQHTEEGLCRVVIQGMGEEWYTSPGEDSESALATAAEGARLVREGEWRHDDEEGDAGVE